MKYFGNVSYLKVFRDKILFSDIEIKARRAKYGGQVSGIILGCLLGMAPLAFIKHDEQS